MSKIVVKDESEFYKFGIFCFNIISNLQESRESFKYAIKLVYEAFLFLLNWDGEKTLYLFKYYLMDIFVYNIKRMNDIKRYFYFKLLSFIAKDETIKERILDLFLGSVENRDLIYECLPAFTENDFPKNELNKTYYRKIKYVIRQIKVNSKVSTKVNCIQILSNLIDINFKFVVKMVNKLSFMYKSAEWSLLLKIKLINFMSLYINKLHNELNKSAKEKTHNSNTKTKGSVIHPNFDDNLQSYKSEITMLIKRLDKIIDFNDKNILKVFLERFSSLFHTHNILLEYYLDKLVNSNETIFNELIDNQYNDREVEDNAFRDEKTAKLEFIMKKCDKIRNNENWRYEEVNDKQLETNGLIRNSSLILIYFLKNFEKNDNKEAFLFWKIFHFAFTNCKFEELNFEYFDSITNQAFEKICKVIEVDKSYYIMDILRRLVQFEIKKEISIKNFNIEFSELLKEKLSDEDIKNTFSSVYWAMNGNDVYIRNMEEIFGNKAHLLKEK